MGVIDWKSKNIEDELSIYVLVSQSLVDQLGESLRIKKGKSPKKDLLKLKNDITLFFIDMILVISCQSSNLKPILICYIYHRNEKGNRRIDSIDLFG